MEEVHLQDHRPLRRQRARVLQKPQLLRFARVTVVESLNNTPPCLLSPLKLHVQLDRSGLLDSGHRCPLAGCWYLPSALTLHILGALWTSFLVLGFYCLAFRGHRCCEIGCQHLILVLYTITYRRPILTGTICRWILIFLTVKPHETRATAPSCHQHPYFSCHQHRSATPRCHRHFFYHLLV